MNEISAVELMAIYRNVSVVDVRDHEEYISGHVPGAIHIPLPTIPLRFSELDKSKTHYVICEAGGRSAQACTYLSQQGYDVINISDGTGAMRMMGAPLSQGD